MRALLIVAAVTGCQPSPAPIAKPALTSTVVASDFAAKVMRVRVHMHVRFAAARRLEQAIVFSDLVGAHGEAKIIAELDEPDALPEWQPYISSVRDAARQIILTKDLGAAATMSALLGRRCAQCHSAGEAKLVWSTDRAPATTTKLAANMASHQWATNKMWEGLIGPSLERWRDGAQILADAPLTIVAEADNLPADVAVGDDVARIRLLAKRALAAETPDARANVYGELLQSCVGCHATIRDR
jgi:hypothetical protein